MRGGGLWAFSTGCWAAERFLTTAIRRAGPAPSSSWPNAGRRQEPAFALHVHRSCSKRRLRLGLDRDHRSDRHRPRVLRADRLRCIGAEVLAQVPSRPADDAMRARRRRNHRRCEGTYGSIPGHRWSSRAPGPESGAPSLGGGGRALFVLRQLHTGVPDLLLQRYQGHYLTSTVPWNESANGRLASISIIPTCTAARFDRPPRRAIDSG